MTTDENVHMEEYPQVNPLIEENPPVGETAPQHGLAPAPVVASCKVGDIVLFTLDSGLHHGEDRPAIVVRVILPETPEEEAAEAPEDESYQTPAQMVEEDAKEKEVLVDLLVFTAGAEDFEAGHAASSGTWLRTGIRHDNADLSNGTMPNYWH